MKQEKKNRKRGQGEGSIYQRSDGRWTAAVITGYKNGKLQRKSFYGKTRADVAGKLTAALNKQQQGLPLIGEKQTVKQFLEQWLEDCKKPSARLSTYLSYQTQIKLRIVPEIGHIKLAKLTPQHIQTMLKNLSQTTLQPRSKKVKGDDAQAEKLPSARTVKYSLLILRMALAKAESWGLIGRNVAKLVDAPTVPKFKVEAIESSEAKIFLQAIEGDRMEALFTVALALGLRRGEALGLQWKDIDFQSRTVKVNRSLQRLQKELVLQELKTESSHRVLELPEILIKKLREHYTRQLKEKLIAGSNWQNTDLVFCTSYGTPIDPRNVKRKLDSILKNANMRHYRIHDLRHFYASLLLAQGVELKVISELLGHSSMRITGDVYAHVLSSLKKQTAAVMDSILTGTN